MATGHVAPRAPITHVYASENRCGLDIDPEILADSVRLHRLKLRLAAAYEGVEVLGNTDQIAGPGDLTMDRSGYIGPMATITLPSLLKRLASVPDRPVHMFARGPKVMQWLLILRFRAQRQHIGELERIDGIVRAIVSPDALYGGYLLELFVPEMLPPSDHDIDAGVPDAQSEPIGPLVDEVKLREAIEEALNFTLD